MIYHSINQFTNYSINRRIIQSFIYSINQLTKVRINQSINQSNNQSTNQLFIDRSARQNVSQIRDFIPGNVRLAGSIKFNFVEVRCRRPIGVGYPMDIHASRLVHASFLVSSIRLISKEETGGETDTDKES